MDLKSKIKDVPNWPKEGVDFKDITPLLEDPEGLREVVDRLAEPFLGQKIDKIVAIDARGFLIAPGVAYKLNAGISLIRKKGKLPRQTIQQDYDLEYASNTIEMHDDTIKSGEKVLIIDDVLATGGTAQAAVEMVEKLGGQVLGIGFLINLKFLKGEEKLSGYRVYSLVDY